jgi:hypothetical protein
MYDYDLFHYKILYVWLYLLVIAIKQKDKFIFIFRRVFRVIVLNFTDLLK